MRVSRTILAVVGVLAVAVAVSAQGDSGERDPAVIKACNEVCKQLVSPTSETYQAGRAATCSSFQRAAPRPKTGNACGDGYNIDSVKASCFAGCDREPHCELRPEDAAVAPLMSAHFRKCRPWEQQLPRPRLHRACVTGLEGAVRVGCAFADVALEQAEAAVSAEKMEMAADAAGIVTDEDEMDRILAASDASEIPPVPVRTHAEEDEGDAAVAAAKATADAEAAAAKAAAERAAHEEAARLRASKSRDAEAAAAAEAKRKAEEAHAKEQEAERLAAKAAEDAAARLAAAKAAEAEAEEAAKAAQQAQEQVAAAKIAEEKADAAAEAAAQAAAKKAAQNDGGDAADLGL